MDETTTPAPLRPTQADQDEAGVDLSLIRFLQGLSPLERLVWMERHARDSQALYEHGRKHREAKTRRDR